MSTSRNPCDRGAHEPERMLDGAAEWCRACGAVRFAGGRWRRPGRKQRRLTAGKNRQLAFEPVWDGHAPLQPSELNGDTDHNQGQEQDTARDELSCASEESNREHP